MQLSVIIVSYNVKYFVEQCLHSVLAACKNISFEIIVVDNNSADKTIDYLQPKFPQVNFISFEVNTGFAKANNKALKIATGKYILYLNPDTIISENVITNCIAFFETHAKAGAAGVKMIDANGNFLPESKRTFPSVRASFFKLSGLAKLFPHSSIINKYALGNLNENEVHEVDVLSGAFFFSRKEILLKLNGFDEDFFMYGEDIDLSYRIKRSGYKIFYLGNSVIVHFKGKSTQKDKQAYVKNFYRAMKIYIRKYYKSVQSFFLQPAISITGFIVSGSKGLSYFFAREENKNSNGNFVLIGDEAAIQSAKKIILANNYKIETLIITNTFSGLKKDMVNIKPNTSLVFCLNESASADCIHFAETYKNNFVFYWHYKNSCSIVSGSNISILQIYMPI